MSNSQYQMAAVEGCPGTSIVTVQSVLKSARENGTSTPSGRYVPARALGWTDWRTRFRAAWLVWSGKADALLWEAD
jgi:hypothetical protein